ncbi:MAG: PASTA domain-containing protein, partial [Clostridia bacterium]|nr:PASTA domain-containing protein [Clostridia bacterium]
EIPLDAKESQPITVVVSLGSGQLTVPAVQGLTYAQAIEKLWQAGFSYNSITPNITNPGYDYIVTKISPDSGSTCNVYDAKIVIYLEKPVTSEIDIPTQSEDNREVSSIPEVSSVPAE